MAERLAFIPSMEPKLVAKPPEGENWIHEIKLDGYRSQKRFTRQAERSASPESGASQGPCNPG
ncbi:MAG: hypothetical protein EOS09_28670 [Mesorhizobium sp.]|nr:MAG: hypothetical protein EOS09_28670 [Mesorhizobium sp.]